MEKTILGSRADHRFAVRTKEESEFKLNFVCVGVTIGSGSPDSLTSLLEV